MILSDGGENGVVVDVDNIVIDFSDLSGVTVRVMNTAETNQTSNYRCFRLKDNGDGLTGPQPSVIGSVDKVFKQVNQFDQYQCLQVGFYQLKWTFKFRENSTKSYDYMF